MLIIISQQLPNSTDSIEDSLGEPPTGVNSVPSDNREPTEEK